MRLLVQMHTEDFPFILWIAGIVATAFGCSPTPTVTAPTVREPAAHEPSVTSTTAFLTVEESDKGPASSGPVLYGYWGLNGFVTANGLADVQQRLEATVFHTATMDPEWAAYDLLPMVRAAGLAVTLRLTGDHEHYTTADGDFDLQAWQRMLAPWDLPDLRPFIQDGTLRGHMLLDDIHNFEGQDPTAAELEEMARTSKALMPGLMTFVRERATDMPVPASGSYRCVDANVNQYKAAHGDVVAFARREAAQARQLGLGIINGLNIANGGDGSSGQPGWGQGKYAMSAQEITRNGGVLARVPGNGMFLNWEYDGQELWSDGSIGAEYFDQPELQAALADLGRLVARQPPGPLLKRARCEGEESPETR